MKLEHYPHHPWKIIEEGWNPDNVKASESIFSLGNGAMGQRANFEEHYSGSTFQGSYVGGVYYPDKTKVGWWKNGYPEYFAKVLNAPNWIGIDLKINGESFDLNTAKAVKAYRRRTRHGKRTLHPCFYCRVRERTRTQYQESTLFIFGAT